jgi:hypothetical protein
MTSLGITLQLAHLVDEIGSLQSKLVLLIGAPHTGKTELLRSLGRNKGVKPLNLGALLGARLAGIPQRQRHLQTTSIMQELADEHAFADILLRPTNQSPYNRSKP